MAQTREIAVFFQKGRVTNWDFDLSKLDAPEPIRVTEVFEEWEGEYWELQAPDIFLYPEHIDWEEGMLRTSELPTEDMNWLVDDHSGSHVVYDLEAMCFLLSQVEMIAPFAPPPPHAAVQIGTVKSAGGRPRKYDWEGALIHLIAIANAPDGLPDGPGSQAAIGRLMLQWFQENAGEEPAESEVKKYARRVVEALGRK
jgi:hypothetical protein